MNELILLIMDYYTDLALPPLPLNKHWYNSCNVARYWSQRQVIFNKYTPSTIALQTCEKYKYVMSTHNQISAFINMCQQQPQPICKHLTVSHLTLKCLMPLMMCSSLVTLECPSMIELFIPLHQRVTKELPHLKRLICGKQFFAPSLLLCLLRNAPRLEELHVSATAMGEYIVQGLHKEIVDALETLIHINTFRGDLWSYSLELARVWGASLTSLHFTHAYCNSKLLEMLNECAQHLRLRSLTGCMDFRLSLINWLGALKPHQIFHNLTHINFVSDGFFDTCTEEELTSAFTHIPHITHLTCYSDAPKHHFIWLKQIVRFWRGSLQSLSFIVPQYSTLSGRDLGAFLAHCKRLKHVRITHSGSKELAATQNTRLLLLFQQRQLQLVIEQIVLMPNHTLQVFEFGTHYGGDEQQNELDCSLFDTRDQLRSMFPQLLIKVI